VRDYRQDPIAAPAPPHFLVRLVTVVIPLMRSIAPDMLEAGDSSSLGYCCV
jgi:hypothetical protein